MTLPERRPNRPASPMRNLGCVFAALVVLVFCLHLGAGIIVKLGHQGPPDVAGVARSRPVSALADSVHRRGNPLLLRLADQPWLTTVASGEADYCDSIGSGEMFVRYSPVNCYWVREIWGVFDTDPAARIHLLDQIVQSVNLTIHGLDWQGGPFQRPAGSQPSLAGIGYGYRDLALRVSWSPAPISQIRLGDTPSPTLAGPADGMTPMYFRIYQQPSRTVLANSADRYVLVLAMMSNYFDAHHPPTASPT